jgi:ATP-dependent helicase/nuclease subunit A
MPLKVYKASAGSGKTFQLTYEYLKLLFRNPENYRHILAVTFTNKAASEMKSRILERLHALATLEPGESSQDSGMLVEDLKLTEEQVRNSSADLLTRILNDYSRFSVGTIDRFFQGVIRAFAREIGLQAGFSLELDRDRMLNEAVDRMFMQITEDKEIQNWLLRFAEMRMENNKGWNFRKDIQDLGKHLFSERYQELVMENRERRRSTSSVSQKGEPTLDGSMGREQLTKFIAELSQIEKNTERKIVALAKDALDAINKNGFNVDQFHGGKRGVAMFFDTVANGGKYILTTAKFDAISDNSKWVSKKDIGSPKAAFAENTLQPLLGEIYGLTKIMLSVSSVRPYMFTLGILNDLSEKILDITSEKNIFMLNDASRFLKGLIGNNPTPFIYEKTGSVYNHIMLDEFQDTSVFQWENFRPLIDHTLSQGMENLVVGDVKQSIYRWRNSDWKILADKVENAFVGQEIKAKSMDENWRSKENVVQFNNSLFHTASRIIRGKVDAELDAPGVSDELRQKWNTLLEVAYNDVNQQVPTKFKGSGGYVRGVIQAHGEGKFKEEMEKLLPEWVMELQDNGYKAGDIAILVRFNNQGASVAQALMEYDREFNSDKKYCFDFVSNESLYLHRNIAIRFIVSLLAYIDQPNDKLHVLELKYNYLLMKEMLHGDLHASFDPKKMAGEVLPEEFMEQILSNRRMPLFELVELIIRDFRLDTQKADLPYIQEFQSIILEMQRDDPGSIHDFLEYWLEFGARKTLHVSDGQDAIQIMTIHKAKGLQFKAVIVPMCNWDLTTNPIRDTILWCDTAGTPFDTIPMVPVKYKSALKETFFAEEYLEEMVMGYVDNLNLLYVALTRTEEAMYIGIPGLEEPKPGKPQKMDNVGHLLALSMMSDSSPTKENQIDFTTINREDGFELGEFPEVIADDQQKEARWKLDEYPVHIRNDSLRLRLKSNDYFLNEDDDIGDHVGFGNLMHEIFAMIHSTKDVEAAVEKYKRSGIIKTKQAERLLLMIQEKIKQEKVKNWFLEKLEIINERAIIVPGAGNYRPDRVILDGERTIVVDYKFGDQQEASYLKQVKRYKDLLLKMDYKNVEGYIWYVMLDEVIKVN